MIKLLHPLYRFGTKLKGPTAQRQAIKSNLIKDQTKYVEDFFHDYSQTTINMFKSNFTAEQLMNSNEMIKRVFSLENATPTQILSYRIEQAIKKYQNKHMDVGSAGVQCAIMSERVIFMINHTKKYPKDFKAARYLIQLIEQRRTMLNYLMRTDYHKYKWVCIDYGIPEVHPKDAHHKHNFRGRYNTSRTY